MAGTDGGGYAAGSYDGRVGVQFWPNAKPPPASAGMTKQQEQLAKWGENFSFKCHPKSTTRYAVNALVFHPKRSEHVATAGADGEVCIWDIKKRERVVVLVPGNPKVGVASIDFSAGGERLAYASTDDWTKGEERYKELSAAGFRNEVRLVSVPRAKPAA